MVYDTAQNAGPCPSRKGHWISITKRRNALHHQQQLMMNTIQLRRSTRALFEAVRRNYQDVARALLEGGMAANVQEPDELADTPLHVAVRLGNESMVKVRMGGWRGRAQKECAALS